MPDVKEKLLNQGAEAVGGSPDALGKVVKAELAKWDKVVKENGIKAE
jgi:tripartite-type tricarboxylate transporter receptor subunit TctC